ncbi:cell division protein SepF [Candidatus Woesearchaeota archaeon]|nr:cell division protein SepF [Candidatus Woesearchaeota archaeon]
MGIFSTLKEKLSGPKYDEMEKETEYVELENDNEAVRSKVIVRPFLLDAFDDVKPVLDSLREGYTIALVNIRPLKDKDLVELKRAINKLKKTTDAIEGEIAGFGEDFLVVTPSFASIYRSKQMKAVHSDEPRVELAE